MSSDALFLSVSGHGAAMSKAASNPSAQPTLSRAGARPVADELVQSFNDIRDELVSTLWYLLSNKDDAQDAAQDAFLKCWRAQASLKEVHNLRAWIFRVALNVARDQQRSAWFRRSKQFAGEDALLSSNGAAPEQVVEKQETQDRLRHAILRLRQDEKEVFLLRQNGELTFEQIAAIRRSPVGTVKTQMRSALHKLRQILT